MSGLINPQPEVVYIGEIYRPMNARREGFREIVRVGSWVVSAILVWKVNKLLARHLWRRYKQGRGEYCADHVNVNGPHESINLNDAELPPTMIDTVELGKIEFGSSKQMRDLFFLADKVDESSPTPITFANHGSFGAVPRVVMAYYHRLQRRVEAYSDLWFRVHSWVMTRKAIQPFAEILNCDPEGLVFIPNATTGINAILLSMTFQKDEVLLCSDATYAACKLIMKHEAKRHGAEYVEFALKLPVQSEQEIVDIYTAELDRLQAAGKKVRFLLIDSITSPTAILMPMERLARLARSRNIICAIDGAHGIGCFDIDLSRFDYDYFVTNLHKWMWSMKGSALLFAGKHVREQLHPVITSHSTNEGFTRRFWQQATRDDTTYISSVEALRFSRAIGTARARAYSRQLLDLATGQMVSRLGYSEEDLVNVVNVTAPSSSSTSSSSSASPASVSRLFVCPLSLMSPTMRLIRLPWTVPVTVAKRAPLADKLMLHLMEEYKVVVPVIYEPHTEAYYIRISANIYNTPRDYDRMIDALIDFHARGQMAKLEQLV